MLPAFVTKELLHGRVLRDVARTKRRGLLVTIGAETRSQRELVEAGHLFEEISNGKFYRYTLSPSGQRMLDQFENT